MIRLYPTFLALITVLFMFLSDNDVMLKTVTVVLCAMTAVAYFAINIKKLYGSENPVFTLVCGWLWVLNTFIQGFLLTNIISKLS